jgi:CubicO group peptidase (beta-lactamase class C family)
MAMRLAHCLSILASFAAFPAQAADPIPASVRVTFDRHGVTSETAIGLADRATGRVVTADSPARIASISKLITAIGAMRLVEAGKLDLDTDVSTLLGFSVRNPAFPNTPITLRLLMSHRSSLTDGADYVLPLDATLKATLADPRAWDSTHAPGTWFQYTNLNFPMVAAVMEKATDERFDRLMKRLVFEPLKLDACFNWSGCSDAAIAKAVVLYRADGQVARDDLHGVRPACVATPARDGSCDLSIWRAGINGAIFSPQGGVRISMRDLATIGRLLLDGGKIDGGRLLSARSIRELRRIEWANDGRNGESDRGFYCAYGLAVQLLSAGTPGCNGNPFNDGRPRFGHAGDAYGLKSGLWIDPVKREGVAYFTTAIAADAPRGVTGYPIPEEEMAQGRWPKPVSPAP